MDPFLLDIPEQVKVILKGDFNNMNPKQLKVIQEKDCDCVLSCKIHLIQGRERVISSVSN